MYHVAYRRCVYIYIYIHVYVRVYRCDVGFRGLRRGRGRLRSRDRKRKVSRTEYDVAKELEGLERLGVTISHG